MCLGRMRDRMSEEGMLGLARPVGRRHQATPGPVGWGTYGLVDACFSGITMVPLHYHKGRKFWFG